MPVGSHLDEGIRQISLFFPQNFLKFSLCSPLLSLWAFALQSNEKKILAPCLVNQHHIYISIGAHSSSERSPTIRGHFLNFYSRAKTLKDEFPPNSNPSSSALKMHSGNAGLLTNRTEFSMRDWQKRLN